MKVHVPNRTQYRKNSILVILEISVFGDLVLFSEISKLVIFYLVPKLEIWDFGGDALITDIEVLLWPIMYANKVTF